MGSIEGSFQVRRIAIIGAGPSGLVAAKYFVEEKAFSKVVVFEQQPEVGGVWNYTETASETLSVPQTNAFAPANPPVVSAANTPPIFPSPMYERLHTNIPHTLMRFGDLPFPESVKVFPFRQSIQEYLVEYSQSLRHSIRVSTQVRNISLKTVNGFDEWDVESVNLLNGKVTTETFDAIVVATGNYSTIYIPDVPNIRGFHQAYPETIIHSKSYRNPAPYHGKKVLVVGNSASGLDIASQIRQVSQQPLLISVQTATPAEALEHADVTEVPQIEEFLVSERGVRFVGGKIEKDIDAIVFCTGYLFNFPFLRSFKTQPPLLTTGRSVHGLYRHLIHIQHPSLAFLGLPMKVVPFPLVASQAGVLSRLWTNRLPLPSRKDMEEWHRNEVQEKGE